MRTWIGLLLVLLNGSATAAVAIDEQPLRCRQCAQWNQPVEPFALAANTWYVGTAGLSAVLLADPAGLILIDGGLPQSAALIAGNIERLGFKLEQLRWILSSHAHADHAGGIAALARRSGATVAASAAGRIALLSGINPPDDPQAAYAEHWRFPAVPAVTAIADGESIRLGQLEVRALATPGHTPGGSSWTWTACSQPDACQTVVYLDSLNAVAAEGYRFLDHPETLAALRGSIERVAGLPCDVAISAHPDLVGLFEQQGDAAPRPRELAQRQTCAQFAAAAATALAARLDSERATR